MLSGDTKPGAGKDFLRAPAGFWAALLMFTSIATGGARPPAVNDAASIAASVDRRYNALQTLRADFSESYSGAGVSRHESGILELKRPGRMRWEYRQPRPKFFISDGRTAYFYVTGEKQMRRAPAKKIDDLRSPLRYLLGHTRLQSELRGLSFAVDQPKLSPGNVVLRGVPKSDANRISQIVLEVNPQHQIERLAIDEADGGHTEFTFGKITENITIPDADFRFVPPPGVEIVDRF